MKILESHASDTVANIRNWNSAFSGVVDAIQDVDNFLMDPDSHKGDEKYLQGIFNSMEVLKSTIGLDNWQKELCSRVYDMIVDLAGHDF